MTKGLEDQARGNWADKSLNIIGENKKAEGENGADYENGHQRQNRYHTPQQQHANSNFAASGAEAMQKHSSAMTLTPDQVLGKFGALNPYILFVWTAMGGVWAVTAAVTMSTTFIVGSVCDDGDNNCTSSTSNASQSYGSNTGTLAHEFHLSGQHAGWAVFTSFLLGIAFGGLVFPVLSDGKGRHRVLYASLFLMGLSGGASAFAPELYSYVVMRFLQGFFFMGCGVVAMILAYESIPLPLRPHTTMLFGLNWVLGYCGVAPLAYWVPEWRHLTLITSAVLMLYAIFLSIATPESFHYMAVRKDHVGLSKWLGKAKATAEWCSNGKRTQHASMVMPTAEHIHCAQQHEVDGAGGSSRVLRLAVSNRIFLIYVVAMALLFLCDDFVYYSLSIYTEQLNGYDRYWKHVFTGAVEAPAYVVAPTLLNRLGRRRFFFVCHVASALALLSIAFTSHPTLRLAAWLVGKFCVATTFVSLYVYASEVFPTVARNACVGFFSLVARLSAAFAPIVPTLASIAVFLPALTFSLVSLLPAVVVWVLPETVNRELPDQPEEMITSEFAALLIPHGRKLETNGQAVNLSRHAEIKQRNINNVDGVEKCKM